MPTSITFAVTLTLGASAGLVWSSFRSYFPKNRVFAILGLLIGVALVGLIALPQIYKHLEPAGGGIPGLILFGRLLNISNTLCYAIVGLAFGLIDGWTVRRATSGLSIPALATWRELSDGWSVTRASTYPPDEEVALISGMAGAGVGNLLITIVLTVVPGIMEIVVINGPFPPHVGYSILAFGMGGLGWVGALIGAVVGARWSAASVGANWTAHQDLTTLSRRSIPPD